VPRNNFDLSCEGDRFPADVDDFLPPDGLVKTVTLARMTCPVICCVACGPVLLAKQKKPPEGESSKDVCLRAGQTIITHVQQHA